MQDRASGLHAYGIFFIAALLFSSCLVLPLSASSSDNSDRAYMTIRIGNADSLEVIPSTTTNAVAQISSPVSMGALQPVPILLPPPANLAPAQTPASNPSAEIGIPVENAIGASIVSSSGQNYWVSALASESFLVSPTTSGGAGPVMQPVQVSGEFSTTGSMLTFISNGQVLVYSGALQSGLPGLITISQVSGQPLLNAGSISSLAGVTSAIPGLWMDTSKRRSRSQIYVEILELMKRGPMTPFEIAFYARLNHKRTKEYTEFLKRSGYLEVMLEDGRSTLVLTKNGLSFLERAKALFQESAPATQMTNVDYTWQ